MNWQPIASAPKDVAVLGWFPSYATAAEGGQVFMMLWNAEKYSSKPSPYWEALGWVWGVRDLRARQPTHWMPLPTSPEPAGEEPAVEDGWQPTVYECGCPITALDFRRCPDHGSEKRWRHERKGPDDPCWCCGDSISGECVCVLTSTRESRTLCRTHNMTRPAATPAGEGGER